MNKMLRQTVALWTAWIIGALTIGLTVGFKMTGGWSFAAGMVSAWVAILVGHLIAGE